LPWNWDPEDEAQKGKNQAEFGKTDDQKEVVCRKETHRADGRYTIAPGAARFVADDGERRSKRGDV